MVQSNSDSAMEDFPEQKSASTSYRNRIVTVVSLSLAAIGVTLVVSSGSSSEDKGSNHVIRRKLLANVQTTKGHIEGEIDWLNRGVGGPSKSPSAGLHKPTWKPSFKPVESADIIALNPRTIGLGGMKGENHKWDEKEILHLIPTHNIDEKKIVVTEDVVADVTTTDVVVTEDVTVPPVVDVTLNDVITAFTDPTDAVPVVSTVDNTADMVVAPLVRSLTKSPPPGSKGALSPPAMLASRPEAVVDVKHGGIEVDADVAAVIESAATKEAEEKAAEEAEEAEAKEKEEEEAAAKVAAEKAEEEEKEKEEEEEAEKEAEAKEKEEEEAAAKEAAEKEEEAEKEKEEEAEKEAEEKAKAKEEEAEKEAAEKAAKKLEKKEKKAEKEAAAKEKAAAEKQKAAEKKAEKELEEQAEADAAAKSEEEAEEVGDVKAPHSLTLPTIQF